MSFEIKHGHVLNVLKGMESESVQCCITSPPYYGLRSYGTEPQVWGNHNGCGHEWKRHIKPAANGLINNVMQGETLDGNSGTRSPHFSDFCLSCNAWRGELGLEPTFQLYISHLIEIFAEVKRVLKKDGTCFVNLGDSFSGNPGNGRGGETVDGGTPHRSGMDKSRNGLPAKSLMNIPARFAIAMTDELKMIQRNEIIWYKRACMPSSAKDRFTVDFEKIFFFAKEPRYKFNQQVEPLADPTRTNYQGGGNKLSNNGDRNDGDLRERSKNFTFEHKNKRCVWDVPFEPQSDEHYAAYPTKLVEPMILAGTDEGDTVLDIFNGTATTGLTALRNRRNYIGIELQEKYIEISRRRLQNVQVNLF